MANRQPASNDVFPDGEEGYGPSDCDHITTHNQSNPSNLPHSLFFRAASRRSRTGSARC